MTGTFEGQQINNLYEICESRHQYVAKGSHLGLGTAHSTLQSHFATHGLYALIYHIARASTSVSSIVTLQWNGCGIKFVMSYVQIVPLPLPKSETTVDVAQRSGTTHENLLF